MEKLEKEMDPILGLPAGRFRYAKGFNKYDAVQGEKRGRGYTKFRVGKNPVTPMVD